MSPPTPSRGNTLGLLAAFTLGIVCMGVAVLVFRPDRNGEVQPARNFASLDSTSPHPNAALRHPVRERFVPIHNSASQTGESVFPNEPLENQSPDRETVTVSQPVPVDRVAAVGGISSENRSHGFAGKPSHTQVTGKITLVGEPPPERVLPLDPACAGEQFGQVTTRFYAVGKDRGLADVVVNIQAKPPEPERRTAKPPLVLTIRGCLYEPYVAAAFAGQRVLIRNEGKVMHNVHLTSEDDQDRTYALLPGQRDLELSFDKPQEFVRLKCDVHPWEFAYVSVFSHPFFAVSDANGNFTLPHLPPGKYTLEARHRKAGMLTKEIAVEDHRGTTVNFEFEVKPPVTASNQ